MIPAVSQPKVSRVTPAILWPRARGCLRAMAAGYTERWAEAEELDVSDLGLENESPEEEALANI